MKVLVIGAGGREHALVWKLQQSPKVEKVFCAPGNGGIAQIAQCVDIKDTDVEGLLEFAVNEKIDLAIVGPEAPLVAGVVDKFREKGLRAFGPSQRAAEIEGSKALAKDIMEKYQIPTAKAATFTDVEKALNYVDELGVPCVVKADGLAAGKGVVVAEDVETAKKAVREMMEDKAFGSAGDKVVIEEFLRGEEVSILAFTDGKTVVPMVSSQDHKRAFDGDQGPNTGGMGAYSPAPIYTEQIEQIVMEQVLKPTIQGLAKEGRDYTGVIYAGLMITEEGPKVLEFNARFGDPETQPVLMRLETDLVEIIEAIEQEKLDEIEIKWSKEAAVCVVVASGGYPGSYEKGKLITGLDQVDENEAIVFHAGTKAVEGKIYTNGGRVLGITAKGDTVAEAVKSAYKAIDVIKFEKMQYRKDIAHRAID
ncbi:phosphoribosylamine--glycine ligase [Desulfitispora alkaliphila]|uniref:phosphoribosylamine--glycine ligase n=1 Tax=Desulfitispora alkaliphila TaxID=622674 RepID=UPI003D2008F8